jgi:uncharacterized membrane protein YhaH (DUF805 family)
MARSEFFDMFAPLSRLTDFSGRATRVQFWPYMLLLLVIYFVGLVLTMGFMLRAMGSPVAYLYGITLICILLAFAAVVRRLHDVGWSGGWMGAYVVMTMAFIAFFFWWRYGVVLRANGAQPVSLSRYMPFMMLFSLALNGIAFLVLIVSTFDGTPGPNRYGPDPKGRKGPGTPG